MLSHVKIFAAWGCGKNMFCKEWSLGRMKYYVNR